jgi:hypothetical protein
MISRLSAFAATFAVLATASLAFAAGSQNIAVAAGPAAVASVKQVRVIQLERVTIVGKRLPADAR